MGQLGRRRLVALLFGGAFASGVATHLLFDSFGANGRRPVSRGRGAPTAFGSVAVLGSRREALPQATAVVHGHGVDGAVLPDWTWSDMVRVDVEVHNGTDRELLMSPGQFRLRVGRDGPTVTPYDAELAPGPLAAGATATTWVSYLAPAEATELWVEYSEAGASDVLETRLHPSSGGDNAQHQAHAEVSS